MLDDKNALVYYPGRMDWYKNSNPKDTIEKEIRLMTLSAQKKKWCMAVGCNYKSTNAGIFRRFDKT